MIYIDFDGTIVDIWKRYYRVFATLTKVEDLTIAEYKQIKQRFMKDELVAQFLGCTLPDNYFKRKAELLEDREFLSLDSLFFASDAIRNMFKKDSVILTKRRNSANLKWQLYKLGLGDLPVVVVSDISKKEWIEANVHEGQTIMVGDSLVDLETGELPYVTPVMVGYGLNTKHQFEETKIQHVYLETPINLYNYLMKMDKKEEVSLKQE